MVVGLPAVVASGRVCMYTRWVVICNTRLQERLLICAPFRLSLDIGELLASNVCLQEAAYKGHYVFLCAVASYDDKRSEK